MAREKQQPLAPFTTTDASEVRRAGGGDAAESGPAMAALLLRYRQPLLSHLIVRKRFDASDADDLLHDFISKYVLEKNLLAKWEQERGKFRTFLLVCLDRFALNWMRERNRGPRNEAEPNDAAPAQRAPDPFESTWARQVLAEVCGRMESHCRQGGQEVTWEVFRLRVILPAMEDAEPIAYKEMVARFGFAKPLQASNALVTAKRMFQRILEEVLREYGARGDEIEDETNDLFNIFSAGRA